MKLSGMVAHLFHAFKPNLALAALVQALLVRDLLMLHEFFHLVESPPTFFAFMPPEQFLPSPSIPPVPALSAKVAIYFPVRFGMIKEHAKPAFAQRAKIHSLVVLFVPLLIACFADGAV